MLEWIAEMITYLLTGVNGFESMSLWDFCTWFPTYQLVKESVTDVFCCIIGVICIAIMFKIYDSLKERA